MAGALGGRDDPVMHTVLAIETSTDIASVAIVREATVLAEQEAADVARHDHVLLPRIQAVLRAASLSLSDLTLLAVGVGPGAFGGLRVGLATIKGLALATSLPCIGISSLQALGIAAPIDKRLVVTLVDAHRGELFAALYARDARTLVERITPFHGTPDHVAAALRSHCVEPPYVMAHGLAAHREALLRAWPELDLDSIPIDATPRARNIAMLAIDKQRAGKTGDADDLLPIYIRDSDAKLPAQPLLLMPETKD